MSSREFLSWLSVLRTRLVSDRCRSQTRLGPHVAVAVVSAGSNSSNSTPSMGTYNGEGAALKKRNISERLHKWRGNEASGPARARSKATLGTVNRTELVGRAEVAQGCLKLWHL